MDSPCPRDSPPPRAATGSRRKEEVYRSFLAFHLQHSGSGSLAPGSGQQLRPGKDWLDSQAAPGRRFHTLDFYRLARDYLGGQPGAQAGDRAAGQPGAQAGDRAAGQRLLRSLSKAFEVLELISLNLYLWPWRKEIKSIKTFTGAFVYFIQPVFPPDVLQDILEKMGYTRKGTSDYVMSKRVNKEEIGQLGFEFFLARAECELMQETLDQVMHGDCQDVLQLRSNMSFNQADCIKYLKGREMGSRGLGEEMALGSEGASKLGLCSEGHPAKSEFSSMPLPLTDDSRGSIPNDPFSTSVTIPSESLDLYEEYTDITFRAKKLESCDYPIQLDESLMQDARTESLVKLSPGQTGPVSLSPFPMNSSEDKNVNNKDRASFDTVDPKCTLKHSVLDAASPIYPEDRKSSKSSHKLESTSSVKYGSFLNGNANSQKRHHVEIELKKMDKEKLPYPIAETAGPSTFHQANHFRTQASQSGEFTHPEPTAVKPQGQTQILRQVTACQTPNIPGCCVCTPTELLRVNPLLDDAEHMGNAPQDIEEQIVREPPQSFYIPPRSLEGRSPSAKSCDICMSPICPNCSSKLSAGQCQVTSRDCLETQELEEGGTGPYLYVTKLPENVGLGLDGDKSVRCNHCKEEEDI
ncbi:uncharacterized protein LOC119971084 [Scyliorhinus canicula]|uniref:uncharacterized protein LOC119971084 n=1 Tax=Scyliorhinus canicula TaxID=7830 RepID=UPI0018F7C225|nr:uncharacterized protein LOC119971084 [Scyliorhinus canicula]